MALKDLLILIPNGRFSRGSELRYTEPRRAPTIPATKKGFSPDINPSVQVAHHGPEHTHAIPNGIVLLN